jgi:hypothetical protein
MKHKNLKNLLPILKLIAKSGSVFESDSICTQISYMGGCETGYCENCPFMNVETFNELIEEVEGVIDENNN